MPARTAVDTSTIVAALLTWHEHHRAARTSLEAALDEGQVMVPVPALIESYAVMTRLPAPHRLSPADAHELLHGNFAELAQVDGLSGPECWGMLGRLAADAIAGGRTYDAQILEVAVRHGATMLLTLNAADFEAIAPGEIEIRSPLE